MRSRSRWIQYATLLLAAAANSSLALGQTEERTQAEGHHSNQNKAAGTEHHQKVPGHTLGVFFGDTTEERRDGFTTGLEYEYRFSERYGIGLTLEHVAGDFHTDVLVVPVAWHNGPWKLYAGPGVEDGEEGTETLFRLGAEYGFHVGKFEISPQIDMDFVGGDRLLVFGVVFAIGF